MKIYKQLTQIAERLAKETAGKKTEYFQANKNDLYEIDKDVLENDSQKGDSYIWIVKENGCGTFMERCEGKEESYTIKSSGEDAKFFLLRCTGINEGSVQEVSYQEALRAYKEHPEPADRVPRRQHIFAQLNDMLGLENYGEQLQNIKMGSEFNPQAGDQSVVRIMGDNPSWMKLDLIRTKMSVPQEHQVLCQKPSATYFANKTPKGRDFAVDGPKYFLIESQRGYYAVISETSEKVFDVAQKSIEQSSTKETDSGMSC